MVYHISIQILSKIKSAGIPCVFIHADTNPPMNIPSVRMDDYLAGQSAGEYLIKHGHEKLLVF